MRITLFIIFVLMLCFPATTEAKEWPPFKTYKSGEQDKMDACQVIRLDIEEYISIKPCEASACASVKNTCGCTVCVSDYFKEEIEKSVSAFHQLCQSFVKCKCAPVKC